MQYVKILGADSYLPTNRISNDDLAQRVDISNEWITIRAGIKFHHIAGEDEKTNGLATGPARHTLATAGILADEINLVIVTTVTLDMQFPSTATIIQHKLGTTNGCPALDTQAVRAGFMYALNTANAYVRNGMAEKVLVIDAETFSRILDWSDRTICVLFGDGTGTVVLGAADGPGIIHNKLQADGNYLDLLNIPGQITNGQIYGTPYTEMDGPGVFKFAVKMLTKVAEEVIREAGMTPDQIDWLVPHQANKRIIESTAKHLGLGMEKVILTVQDHGNASTASIPLTLNTGIQGGRVQRGHNLLLEGTGGSFAWGTMLLKY